jgi:hypothetical protein
LTLPNICTSAHLHICTSAHLHPQGSNPPLHLLWPRTSRGGQALRQPKRGQLRAPPPRVIATLFLSTTQNRSAAVHCLFAHCTRFGCHQWLSCDCAVNHCGRQRRFRCDSPLPLAASLVSTARAWFPPRLNESKEQKLTIYNGVCCSIPNC